MQPKYASKNRNGQKMTVSHLTNKQQQIIILLHSTIGGLYDYKC